MSATICIVALSSTHKTILLTWVLPKNASDVATLGLRQYQRHRAQVKPTAGNLWGFCRGRRGATTAAMATHRTPLHQAAAEAIAQLAGIAAGELKVEAPPRAELGDLAVGCFAIAKQRGANPAQVASELAAAFRPTELLASASAAGPFINFRANRAAAYRWLIDAALTSRLVPRDAGAGQTI